MGGCFTKFSYLCRIVRWRGLPIARMSDFRGPEQNIIFGQDLKFEVIFQKYSLNLLKSENFIEKMHICSGNFLFFAADYGKKKNYYIEGL